MDKEADENVDKVAMEYRGVVQDENRFEDTPPSNISAALLLAVWTKVSKLDKNIYIVWI